MDPPLVLLVPSRDTTVDSVGVLQIRVTAVDQSRIKRIEFYLVGGLSGFPPVAGDSSVFSVSFPINLSQYKHGSFGFYVRARDILDLETVTPTVTVTVR